MPQSSKAHQRQGNTESHGVRARNSASASAPHHPAIRWQSVLVSLTVMAAVVLGLVALVHAVAGSGSATDTTGTTGAGSSLPTSDTTSSDATSASNGSNGSTGAPGGTAGRQVAPAFTLTTLAGTPFSLASAHGHPVVLYFMATTCGTCVQGSQDLAQALKSAHVTGAQAVAIDINPNDSRADLASFVQATGVPASAPIVWGVDAQFRIARAYGVQTLETTVVIDAQGRLAYENPGPIGPQQLAQLVQKAV